MKSNKNNFRFNNSVIQLNKKVTKFFIYLALQNHHATFIQSTFVSFPLKSYDTDILLCSNINVSWVYAYQVNTSLARTGLYFQNDLHILKLLFDIHY